MRKSVLMVTIIGLVAGPGIMCERGQAAEFIACPLKQATTEITTPLPKPWWNTPQGGMLERVRTQIIGGKNTLVCEYQAYGRTVGVMREFPNGAVECRPAKDGFMCDKGEQRGSNDQGQPENPSVFVSPVAPAPHSPLYGGGQKEGVQPAAPARQRPHGNLEDDQVLNPVGDE